MHLRPDILARRWSTFDLPVLPFLAPRVFQPWPWPACCARNHSTTRLLHIDTATPNPKEGISDAVPLAGDPNLRAWETTKDSSLFESRDDSMERLVLERERKISEIIWKHRNDLKRFVEQREREERELALQRRREEIQLIEQRRIEEEERIAKFEKEEGERQRLKAEQDEKRKFELEERQRSLYAAAEAELKQLEDKMEEKLVEEARRRLQEEESMSHEMKDRTQMMNSQTAEPSCENSMLERPDDIQGAGEETIPKINDEAMSLERSRDAEIFAQKFVSTWGRARPSRALSKKKLKALLSDSQYQKQLILNLNRLKKVQRPRVLSVKRQSSFLVRRTSGEGLLWYRRRSRSSPSASQFHCRYEEWYRRYYLIAHGTHGLVREKPPLISFSTWMYSKAFKDEYINHETSSSLRQAWEKVPLVQRVRLWPELMITSLRDYPEKAMKVLCGTYTEPYPPAKPISDSLDFIIWYHLRHLVPSDDNPALEIFEAISQLLSQGPKDHIYLSQTSIYLLMVHLPSPEYIEKFYKTLDRSNHPLHHNTLIQFCDRLAKAGERFKDTAYEIMENIGSLPHVDFNTPSMLSLCTTLIMKSGQDTKLTHTEVFEYMLGCGLRPNIITYNTLLYKTLQAREPERGWQIYELMKENGIEPNSYTYSILLNDAKYRGDQPAILHITNAVREKSLLSQEIVTDMLHAMFLEDLRQHWGELSQARKENRQPHPRPMTYFEKMLPVYCEYFKFGPLARLIPGLVDLYKVIAKSDSIPPQRDDLIEPRAAILGVMLTALLRSFDDPETPKIFYNHFKTLVRNNDPIVADIAIKRPKDMEQGHFRHIYNLTLLALGNYSSGVRECLKIVADMTAKAPALPEPDKEGIIPNPILHPPKPDVTTWNVLVSVFMRHRQTRAAERVIEMMRDRGIEPTYMTWSNLLKGYALMQETRMAVNVMHRLEQSGFKVTRSTWSALRALRDRRALILEMKRIEEQRKEKEIGQFEKLKERLSEGSDAEGSNKISDVEQPAELTSLENFVVRDMPTKEYYIDVNTRKTVWRRLELFQKIDKGNGGARFPGMMA